MPTNYEPNLPHTLRGSNSLMDLRLGFKNPYGTNCKPMYARVIKVNWYSRTIDCVGLHDNAGAGPWTDVPVISSVFTQSEGQHWMPTIADPSQDTPQLAGEIEGVLDALAIIDFISGDPLKAVCLGFITPGANELSFLEPGLKLTRHVSNIYERMTKNGTFEFAFPDGTYIKICPSEEGYALTDLTQEVQRDSDKKPWTIPVDNPRIMIINHPSGTTVTIDQSGSISISSVNRLDISAPTGSVTIRGVDLVDHTHHFDSGSNGTTSAPLNP